MNKKMLLLTVSFLTMTAGSALALTAADQLKAMKEVFVADFNKMDDDKDGKLSQKEYLSHQFENFRANIINATGFDDVSADMPAKSAAPRDAVSSMDAARSNMQFMADYDVELDDDTAYNTDYDGNPLPEIDLSVSEDESLKNFIEDLKVSPEEKARIAAEEKAKAEAEEKAAKEAAAAKAKAEAEAAKRDEQIGMMLNTIKQTLPKKIDEMTTWTDIEYKNKAIAYIYKAEVNTAALTAAENKALQSGIKNEACVKAYAEMCPKIKPLFIDDGINVKIRYIDTMDKEISTCEFNDETCGDDNTSDFIL